LTKLSQKGKVAQLLQKVKAAELLTRTAKDQKTVSSVMPDDSLQSQARPISKRFTKLPNDLIDAWLKGHVSEPCFKMITLCRRHSEQFHIKYKYLHETCGMSESTIKKGEEEALKRGMIEIEKTRVGRSTVKSYKIKDEAFWNLKPIHQLSNELVNFTNSQLSDSELSDSVLSDSELSYYKKTNPKKTKFKNTNVCKKAHTHWTCDYSPQSIVDALAEHGIIKRNKSGFVPNIETWNKHAQSELAGLNEDELKQFIGWTQEELRGQFLKLEKGNLQKLRAACFADEKTLEYEEQQDIEESYEVEYNQKPLDDMPF
jgi:hypothetical protein